MSEYERDTVYDEKFLLESLQTLAQDLQRPPTVSDVRNLSEVLPDVSTYERKFGSWKQALEAAGLESRHGRDDEHMLAELVRFMTCHGRPPTKRHCIPENGLPSAQTLRNRFGKFSIAVALAKEMMEQTEEGR